MVQDEPDDRFLLGDAFLAGIGQLARRNLAYDILIFPRHLPAACEMVHRFPEQRFILDHLAKPFIARGELEPWATDLRALAAFPNVACKVSGMVTEARWPGWRRDDFTPYLDVVLSAFGADRVMVGSDWPVCLVAGEYAEVMGIVLEYVQALSPAERAAVLGETAQRWYRIE